MCSGGFVNHEPAQGPRDQTYSQSESSDGRERCAGSSAMIVEVPGSIIREEAVNSKMRKVIEFAGSGAEVSSCARLGPPKSKSTLMMTPRHIRATAITRRVEYLKKL